MWLLKMGKWDSIKNLEIDLCIFENVQRQWHWISVKKGCQEKNKK